MNIYESILSSGHHTLIAGATGSGKSTVISSLIHTAIHASPSVTRLVLIDPKRIDMIEYSAIPHTVRYATEPDEIESSLQYAIDIMESRYDYMARKHLKEYDGGFVYVIIDEVADLMTDRANKRRFSPLIQRLAQLGRASHVTVIMATQCCLRTIIDSSVKCNFSSRLALRTATAQDSRNIIDEKGAELLPDPQQAGYAQGIWRSGSNTKRYDLPRFTDHEREQMIDHWNRSRKPKPKPSTKEKSAKPRGLFSLFGHKTA